MNGLSMDVAGDESVAGRGGVGVRRRCARGFGRWMRGALQRHHAARSPSDAVRMVPPLEGSSGHNRAQLALAKDVDIIRQNLNTLRSPCDNDQ